MSTKITIACNFDDSSPANGVDYHWYRECFDKKDNIWLGIASKDFEVTPDYVRVQIPKRVIEHLVKKLAEESNGG